MRPALRFWLPLLAAVSIAVSPFAVPAAAGAQGSVSAPVSAPVPEAGLEGGTTLAYLIELFRRQDVSCPGEGGFGMPPELTYTEALARAAEELARSGRPLSESAGILSRSLAAQGFALEKFRVLTTNAQSARDAFARLQAEQCGALRDAVTHIGVYRDSERWWVVMAVLRQGRPETPGPGLGTGLPYENAPPMVPDSTVPDRDGAENGGEGSITQSPVSGSAAPVIVILPDPEEEPAGSPAVPGSSEQAPAGAIAVTPPPPPTAPVREAASPAMLSPEARGMFSLVNAARAQGGNCGGTAMAPVPELTLNAALVRAAQEHASDMAAREYFGIVSPDGRTVEARIADQGYVRQSMGVLIAQGPQDPAAILQLWTGSDKQCRQVMSPLFQDIGIGAVNGYWSIVLGAPPPVTAPLAPIDDPGQTMPQPKPENP